MYQTQKGFTLIELLIVITIAAVMAVIAFPNMNQWIASRRAASQAEQIANLLRFARNEAVRLNLPVYICPVKIKSDGSHNGCIHKKTVPVPVLVCWPTPIKTKNPAIEMMESIYLSATSFSMATLKKWNTASTIFPSVLHVPPSPLPLQKSGGVSFPMVHLNIQPMARIINFQTATSKLA